jgi:sugar lactone lactonase YvrE
MAICSTGRAAAVALDFTVSIDRECFATLVLEDSAGNRVRNLISETRLGAGEHHITWDTDTDSILVDNSAAGVAPEGNEPLTAGTYAIRGLVRDRIDLRYEFTPYNAGTPPWETVDGSGQWMADHTPPVAAAFDHSLQEIVLSSDVSESSAGVIWVDMDMRKTFEYDNLSSAWRCPGALACDRVTGRVFGAVKTGKLEIWELTNKNAVKLLALPGEKTRGIAAHDDILAVTQKNEGMIVLFDISQQIRFLGLVPVDQPRGCMFDTQGRFVVISKRSCLRGMLDSDGFHDIDTLAANIAGANSMTIDDSTGDIYIGRFDTLNTIVALDSTGSVLRHIGNPGPERPGVYDSLHMVRPTGMAIDSKRRLWVAEANYIPKRVSVWSLDGKLLKQYFGPPKYGGGGTLDPCDTTRLYYAEERGRGSFEMKLDWENGAATVSRLLERWSGHSLQTPYCHDGTTYITNEHQGYPTSLIKRIYVHTIDHDTARTLALVGPPPDDSLLRTGSFASMWNPENPENYLFFWSDLDYDARMEPSECRFFEHAGLDAGAMSMNDNFEMTIKTSQGIYSLPLSRFTDDGVPVWIDDSLRLATEKRGMPYRTCDGATIIKADPIWGLTASGAQWTYPNQWPGVHESWENQNPPTYGGEMVGVTKFIYNSFAPRQSDIGEIFTLNGNMGNVYLMSSDGLFVATLFEHFVTAGESWPLDAHRGSGRGGWHMPEATRGMLLNDVSGGEEMWWPSITQTVNGGVYLNAGHEHNSIIRVENLESIRRVSLGDVHIDENALSRGKQFELDMTFETSSSARGPVSSIRRPRVRLVGNRLMVERIGTQAAMLRIFRPNGRMVASHVRRGPRDALIAPVGNLGAGTYYYRVHYGPGVSASGTFAIVP